MRVAQGPSRTLMRFRVCGRKPDPRRSRHASIDRPSQSLDFTFDDELTALIDEYIHQYRPHLISGANSDFLFPGLVGGPKTANMFSGQITDRIEDVTGLRLTVHQFRHAAAAVYLRHHPGAYEVVKRLLGHRNMQTTINFYCGLETVQASQQFGKMIRGQMTFQEDVA